MEIKDKNKYARIHSIETFGTVDGPGIRFVIFMQGCALRCKYCHNRDTWDIAGGKIISLEEILDKIERYKSYIIPSGGGVTLTGGEPLLQVKFVIQLFKELKKRKIPTALDTSGMFDINDDIKEVLKYTDLVLLDIKHINSKKCKDLVGFSNEKELTFAKYLSDNNIPVWIRQVIVPGITDDEEDLTMLKSFLSSLKNVKNIELIPYHELGKYKWENLGFKYELEGIPQATSDDIRNVKKILGL